MVSLTLLNIPSHRHTNKYCSLKMTMIHATILSCALLFPCVLSAQSTSLEPAEGYFSSYQFSHQYHVKVRDILLKGVTDTPDAMLLALGNPEGAIVFTKGEWISLKCSERIWNNNSPEKITVEKTSLHISKELAEAIHNLWFDALGTTSYPSESRSGLDGVTYYFTSFKLNHGLRAGKAWSPEKKSLPYELLEVAHGLGFRTDGGKTAEKEFLDRVLAIHAKVKQSEQGGADQPATIPQSKSSHDSTPNPESKPRPQ